MPVLLDWVVAQFDILAHAVHRREGPHVGISLMPEHIIDDEGIDDPGLRTWFDEMRDRHNAEEKAEQIEPQENPSTTPHRPS